MILIRSFKKSLYFLLLSLFLLTVASSIWKPQVLIAALPDRGFFDNTELLIPFLLLLQQAMLSLATFSSLRQMQTLTHS